MRRREFLGRVGGKIIEWSGASRNLRTIRLLGDHAINLGPIDSCSLAAAAMRRNDDC